MRCAKRIQIQNWAQRDREQAGSGNSDAFLDRDQRAIVRLRPAADGSNNRRTRCLQPLFANESINRL